MSRFEVRVTVTGGAPLPRRGSISIVCTRGGHKRSNVLRFDKLVDSEGRRRWVPRAIAGRSRLDEEFARESQAGPPYRGKIRLRCEVCKYDWQRGQNVLDEVLDAALAAGAPPLDLSDIEARLG